MLNRKHTRTLPLALAAAAFCAPAAYGQTYSVLYQEGQALSGVGNWVNFAAVEVNNLGQTLVFGDTDAATTADAVLVFDGAVIQREGDSIQPPDAIFTSAGRVSLNNLGNFASDYNFDGPFGADDDSGIYYNGNLVLQGGQPFDAPGAPSDSIWIGFFGTHLASTPTTQMLLLGSTETPTGGLQRALTILTLDGSGALASQQIVGLEGVALPGMTDPVEDFETDQNEFAFNNNGVALFAAHTTGATTSDSFIYLTGTGVIAQEGSPSPVAGRNWDSLASMHVALNDNGDWAHLGHLAGGSTTDDHVIIRNGSVFVAEGDAVPGLPDRVFDNLASAEFVMDDAGNLLWVGEFDAPSSAEDRGLFYNHTLLLQEGVSTIDGLTVTTLNTVAETLAISDDGRFAIIDLTLDGSLDTVVMIAIPEPSAVALLAGAPLALLRRRRRA